MPELPESVIAILVPTRVNEQLFGLIALRFAAHVPAADLSAITSLSAQMGWGLALLQRQARLRHWQRSHETLVAAAPCAVIQLGPDSKVLAWNAAAERIFGWRAADVQGRRLPTLSCGASDPFAMCCEGALGGRATRRIETKATTYTGDSVDVVLAASPQFNEHGAVESVLLVAEAIGDRKRAERLAQLQNRVTQILARGTAVDETIAAALALLCSEYGWACGEFWSADREGRRFKRQTSAHLSAANAVHFDHEMAARGERTDELAVRVSGALQAVSFPGFAADRSVERAFLAAQCGLHDALGIRIAYGRELIGAIVFVAEQIEKPDAQLLAWLDALGEQVGQFVSHRRTEESLRAAEQKLFQSQKLETVGRLVGGVAHDFNNLMTIILGYGELLVDGQVEAELVRDAHREILDAGKHAALLTRRLLAFSRKETVNPVSLHLNVVIEQLEMMIRRLIGPNIQLRFELAASLREVCRRSGPNRTDPDESGRQCAGRDADRRRAHDSHARGRNRPRQPAGTARRRAGPLCGALRERHGLRHRRGGSRAALRSVLQHKARNKWHRSRSVNGARQHASLQRADCAREQAGPRHALRSLFPRDFPGDGLLGCRFPAGARGGGTGNDPGHRR